MYLQCQLLHCVCVYIPHDFFTCAKCLSFIRMTWNNHMHDMTLLAMSAISPCLCVCLTWLFTCCDMTLLHMRDLTHSNEWYDFTCNVSRFTVSACVCDVTPLCGVTWLYFICVTWQVKSASRILHVGDMTYSYMWHDSFHRCDMSPLHVWQDTCTCVTWLILTRLTRIRVVPRRISNLERKRGQYQDSGFVRAKRQRNVASKRRYLRNVWKEPCRGCGFVTFVTFLRCFDILGFAKKTKKIHTVWQKPRNVTKFKSVTLWYLGISQNVTLFQIFGTKLRLPLMFGFGLFACFYESVSCVYVFFSTCRSTCVAHAACFV